MTKQETVKIIAIIKTVYPKFFISESEAEQRLQIDTWHSLFVEEPFKLVEEAVKALICTLKYPPTIADIKEKIALITQPEEKTDLEAWGIVLKGIQDANYRAQEHFNNFPPIIQKLVGSPGQLREWAMMDSETVNSVIQSNFMRSYKAKAAQEKEKAMLPESTKQLIIGLSERMAITDGRNK